MREPADSADLLSSHVRTDAIPVNAQHASSRLVGRPVDGEQTEQAVDEPYLI